MKVTTPFLWAALWLVGLSFFASPVARACANHHYPNPHDHEDHPALGVVPPRYLVEEDVFLPEEDLFFEEEEDDHYCSTHPTEDDIRQGTDTMTDYATRRRLQKNKETSPIVVPVVIHRILYTQERPLGATDEQVAAQMEVLNDAFAPHFSFVLTDQTKTVNATWYRFLSLDTPELIAEMKAALHQGGPETLNVYINFFRGAGGIATFPQAVKKDPILDGIIIKVSTMPGGRITSKQGKTAVHEVGHWLGLYHTFMVSVSIVVGGGPACARSLTLLFRVHRVVAGNRMTTSRIRIRRLRPRRGAPNFVIVVARAVSRGAFLLLTMDPIPFTITWIIPMMLVRLSSRRAKSNACWPIGTVSVSLVVSTATAPSRYYR